MAHALPQAARAYEAFGAKGLAVVGLHTVFDHHEAMTPRALEAFIFEYRLRFPIGVDAPSERGPIPQTMARLGLRGTPSTLLLDRQGRIRLHHFGVLDDLRLGEAIGRLLGDAAAEPTLGTSLNTASGCADEGCST